MTGETAAGQDRLYVLIEVEMPPACHLFFTMATPAESQQNARRYNCKRRPTGILAHNWLL